MTTMPASRSPCGRAVIASPASTAARKPCPAGVAELALVQGFGAVMLYGGVAACRAAGALKSGSRGGYNLGTLASVA